MCSLCSLFIYCIRLQCSVSTISHECDHLHPSHLAAGAVLHWIRFLSWWVGGSWPLTFAFLLPTSWRSTWSEVTQDGSRCTVAFINSFIKGGGGGELLLTFCVRVNSGVELDIRIQLSSLFVSSAKWLQAFDHQKLKHTFKTNVCLLKGLIVSILMN